MTWVVEKPKYEYGYGYSENREYHRFETHEEALVFANKLTCSKQIYEV